MSDGSHIAASLLPTVLVIDDDETTLDSFAHSLRLDGFRVLTACTAEADSRS